MYANNNNVIYFLNFGNEHVSKEIKKFIGKKNVITNIYRTQVRFIGFMLKDKCLLDYTNLFSPNNYGKNDKIQLKCFQ